MTAFTEPGQPPGQQTAQPSGSPDDADDAGRALVPPPAVMRFPYRVGTRSIGVATRQLVRLRYGVADLAQWGEEQRRRFQIDAQLFIPSLPDAALGDLAAAHGDRILWVRQRFPHYWADLSQGFEALMAGMSSKTRSTLRRKERKWAETCGGGIDARSYATPEQMDEFLSLAGGVSKQTYQHRLLGAGLPDSGAFRMRARHLAGLRRAFGFLLFRDGRPVAYLWCPIDDGAAIYAYVGHLDEQSDLSPGTILQMHALRVLAGSGAARFYDFTPGKGQHKQIFATAGADCAEVVVLDATLGNRWLIASQRGFHGAAEWARERLERAGLAGRLRRLIRGQRQ